MSHHKVKEECISKPKKLFVFIAPKVWMCAYLLGSSVTPPNTHIWKHCSGRVFLSGEERLNFSAVAKKTALLQVVVHLQRNVH